MLEVAVSATLRCKITTRLQPPKGVLQLMLTADYISHIAIGSMGFTPGSIEHCRDGGVIDTGTIPNV